MNDYFTLEQFDETADLIRSFTDISPKIGLILGSGLGPLAESVEDRTVIPYKKLPNWPVSTVEGHTGELVLGNLEGEQVVVMQGRAHYYEGYSMVQIGFPVRVMQRLGIEILIVTNAAGAVNPDFVPGDLLGVAGEAAFESQIAAEVAAAVEPHRQIAVVREQLRQSGDAVGEDRGLLAS